MALFHTNVLDPQIKALPTVGTAQGSVVTFETDLEENLIDVECEIVYSQAEGTPTPTSSIPINTFSEMNVGHDANYGGFINFNQLSPDTNVKTISNTAAVSGTASYVYTDHLTVIGHVYLLMNVVTEFVSSEISKYRYYYNNDPYAIDGATPDTLYKATVADVRIFAVNFQSSNVGKMITTMSFAPQCFDLTQMFGSTIADYIYGLETETAGAGVAYFRNLLPNSYYDYTVSTVETLGEANNDGTGNTYNIPFITPSDKAIYFQGLLNGTYGFVDLSSLSWSYQSSGERFVSADISSLVKAPATNEEVANIICSKLTTTYANNTTLGRLDNSIAITSTSKNIVVKATSAGTTQAGIVAYLSGCILIYELETQTTPTITEAQFKELCNTFLANRYIVAKGKLNISAGLLTITHDILTLYGTENIILVGSGTNRRFNCDTYPQYNSILTSSHFDESGSNVNQWGYYRMVSGSYLLLTDNNSQMADETALKTWLANQYSGGTPVQFVCELTTPITIQLSATQIEALLNKNNIFCDTSGDTTVKFLLTVGKTLS